MDTAGCNCIVTGGASGLGLASARALVDAGAAVTMSICRGRRAAVAAGLGGAATFAAADVTDGDALDAAVEPHSPAAHCGCW